MPFTILGPLIAIAAQRLVFVTTIFDNITDIISKISLPIAAVVSE